MSQLVNDFRNLYNKVNLLNAALFSALVYVNAYCYNFGYLKYFKIDSKFINLSATLIIESIYNTGPLFFIAVSLGIGLIYFMMPEIKVKGNNIARNTIITIIFGIGIWMGYLATRGTDFEKVYDGYLIAGLFIALIIIVLGLLLVGILKALEAPIKVFVYIANFYFRLRHKDLQLQTQSILTKVDKPKTDGKEPNIFYVLIYSIYLFPAISLVIGSNVAGHTYSMPIIHSNDGKTYAIIQVQGSNLLTLPYDSTSQRIAKGKLIIQTSQPNEVISNAPIRY